MIVLSFTVLSLLTTRNTYMSPGGGILFSNPLPQQTIGRRPSATGFDPQTLQPVENRYTDYAIPIHDRKNSRI
jgi:hypothetical protein